jgi:hypothetical protein
MTCAERLPAQCRLAKLGTFDMHKAHRSQDPKAEIFVPSSYDIRFEGLNASGASVLSVPDWLPKSLPQF